MVRATTVGAIAALAIGTGATFYWVGAETSPMAESPDPTPTGRAAPVAPPVDGATAAATPEAAALAWLDAAHTLTWADPGPDAWIDRTLPVLTGQARHEAEAARGGSGGADWQTLRSGHCEQKVTASGSIIPPEAPRTSDTAWVQLEGTLATLCATDNVPPSDLAATVLVERGNDGLWRVAERMF